MAVVVVVDFFLVDFISSFHVSDVVLVVELVVVVCLFVRPCILFVRGCISQK